MPDDYYVSQYSGEEIDALLGSAGAGAVRYDLAQSLTAAQQAQARGNIGAAPSGGGVMESAPSVESSSASESYAAFCAKLDAVLETMPDSSVKFLNVYPPQYYGYGLDMCALYKANNDYASVYTIGSYNINRQGFRMIKHKLYDSDPAGQWDPLEYINPDMQLGVEYRTTERYIGKPVYTQIINCGSMPNIGSQKSISIATLNVAVVTFISGWCTYYAAMFDANLLLMTMSANNVNIVVTNLNRTVDANAVMYARIKYTKNTD